MGSDTQAEGCAFPEFCRNPHVCWEYLENATDMLKEVNAMTPPTALLHEILECQVPIVKEVAVMFSDYIKDVRMCGQPVVTLYDILLLGQTWTPRPPADKATMADRKLHTISLSVMNFANNLHPYMVEKANDDLENSLNDQAHIATLEPGMVEHIMRVNQLFLQILMLQSAASPAMQPPPQPTSLENAMKFLGITNEPGPSKKQKPKSKKSHKGKTQARPNQIERTNHTTRTNQLNKTNQINTPHSVARNTLNSSKWHDVIRRTAQSFTLLDVMQRYYNIQKLRRFENFRMPKFEKAAGKVLVYDRPGNSTHISISPRNLPNGFHLTNSRNPASTRRWYFDGQGQLRYSSTSSVIDVNSAIPPEPVKSLASSFTSFLHQARL